MAASHDDELQDTINELLNLTSNIGIDGEELFRLDRLIVGFSCNPYHYRRRLQSETPRDRFLRHLSVAEDAASHSAASDGAASHGSNGEVRNLSGSILSDGDVGTVETIYVAAAADNTDISAQSIDIDVDTSTVSICHIDLVLLKRMDLTLVKSLVETFNKLTKTHTHLDTHEEESIAFIVSHTLTFIVSHTLIYLFSLTHTDTCTNSKHRTTHTHVSVGQIIIYLFIIIYTYSVCNDCYIKQHTHLLNYINTHTLTHTP
eukprot:GHVR01166311.1.p1 GENE.GHVR01166311.1~~GHVR01166311.1.p1  ORF type:complete len:288 (-),score=113.44 GHVR01166311.1:216-995(-)